MSESVQSVVSEVVASAKTLQPVSQTPPVEQKEAKPAPEVETPKKDDDFSSKFAALSRREKQLIEREKRFKQFEEEANQKSSKATSWEEKLKKVKENPSSVDELLAEAGLSFEDIVNAKLGIGTEEKQMTADEVYKKIKSEMEESSKKEEEERNQKLEAENAQVISDFQNEIKAKLTQNADKYELINYQGDFDLVFDVIQEYYNANGEVLSIEAAADEVEKHLDELVTGATKLKKIASRFAPKVEVNDSISGAKETKPLEQKKTAPTLSNELNARTSSSKNPAASIEESKKRAAALLRWS